MPRKSPTNQKGPSISCRQLRQARHLRHRVETTETKVVLKEEEIHMEHREQEKDQTSRKTSFKRLVETRVLINRETKRRMKKKKEMMQTLMTRTRLSPRSEDKMQRSLT